MPRKRIAGKTRIGYTSSHITHLRSGHDFFGDGFGHPPDLVAMKAGWADLKAEVMEADRRHHGLFHRPWSWWTFDRKMDPPREKDEQKRYLVEHPQFLTTEERSLLT